MKQLLFIFAVILAACGQANDPFVVKGTCAVFYAPDSAEMTQLKQKIGEDDYEKVLDDNNFYNAETMQELKLRGIRAISSSSRYIRFIKDNGEEVNIDKNSLSEKWGIILFDGKKDPLSIGTVEAEEDLDEYFDR